MLDRLPWSHSFRAGAATPDAAIDARGSTVQLANGFLYLDAAADPAHSLLGYDEPPRVEADAETIARKLEAIAKGYRCAALVANLEAGRAAALEIADGEAATADALAGEPSIQAPKLIAIENDSLGRSGAWLASLSWRRKPNVIVVGEAIAAGAPFAAVLVKASRGRAPKLRIDVAIDPSVPCRVAGVIAAVETSGLLTQAQRSAAYLAERLRSAKAASGGEIAAISRLPFGASLGFKSRSAAQMKRKLCERGVLVGLAGDRLVVLPPLIIRPAEIDVISGALRGALANTPTWRPSACCAACEGLAAEG